MKVASYIECSNFIRLKLVLKLLVTACSKLVSLAAVQTARLGKLDSRISESENCQT